MAPATRATPRSSRFGWVRAATSEPRIGSPTDNSSSTERARVITTPSSRVSTAVPTRRNRPCRIAKARARSGNIHGAINIAPITTALLLASSPRVAIIPAARVMSTTNSWSARASSSNWSRSRCSLISEAWARCCTIGAPQATAYSAAELDFNLVLDTDSTMDSHWQHHGQPLAAAALGTSGSWR